MTDRELELKLKNAVETCTPDVLDKIMDGCDAYKEPQGMIQENEEYAGTDYVRVAEKSGKLTGKEPDKRGRKRWNQMSRFMAMAAMLILILGAGTFGLFQYGANRVVSIVQFDVNPSVEIRLNKKEEVVEAKGLNTDGENILSGMKLEGLDIYTATNAIVGSLLKHGYIDELANSILLSIEDDDSARGAKLQEELSGEINAILEGASVNASILSQYVDGESVDQISEEYGISHGKAALIEHILASNSNYTFEELSKLSVNELNLIISNPKNQVENVETTGEAAKDAYIGEEAANQIAFAHAGITESSVYELEVEIDYEYGSMVYDVEFASGGKEYDYYIDAVSGKILEHEVEEED